MKAKVPSFVEGVDYARVKHGKYRYVLLRPVTVSVDHLLTKHPIRLVRERYHVSLGEIHRYAVKVEAGYAWDGCTCSPDHPKNLLASVVHDILFQFSGVEGFPYQIDRYAADEIFAAICRETGFKWGWIYRIGLGLGSWTGWGKLPLDWLEIEPIL